MNQPQVDPLPPEMRRLPRPPAQRRDVVNDLGWLSRGLARKADAAARPAIEAYLLAEGEDSGLPPDPVEPPPLPDPPVQRPDTETRGCAPDDRSTVAAGRARHEGRVREVRMKTRKQPTEAEAESPRLPPSPQVIFDDRVNDPGWLSRGPSRRADREAARELEPLALRDGEESWLPPDPPQGPPLPAPPRPIWPDHDERGG